jgi:L-ascorbate metabolism protein UlaG (beta-lactamase superfamily)
MPAVRVSTCPDCCSDRYCSPIHVRYARGIAGTRLTEISRSHHLSNVIVGPRHRVFFSGDTGYTKDFVDVGSTVAPLI